MKNLKKVLALVLAVAMLMGFATVASAVEYKDAEQIDANYSDAVLVLSTLGILDGFPDGTFQPKGTLTRGQAAKIVSIVHNATIAGKIQDIGALYANSGDWFADSKDHWARAYINYCRVCKLADGMSETTFAPDGLLTGTQFLKMMLNVLGFVAEKEGYLGTGWDINVLERANQVGLLANLPKNWKPAEPITREEAVQVIFNALVCGMVEYGKQFKGYAPQYQYVQVGPELRKVYTETWKQLTSWDGMKKLPVAFVTNEIVDYTGWTLAEAMGVSCVPAKDEFYRPGYTWSYNGKSYFFMKKPAIESWNAIGECDMLKAFGIPETSTRVIPSRIYIDGKPMEEGSMTHAGKACLAAGREYGCTGTLTQAWIIDGQAWITEIHTWLGQVESVKGASHGANGNVTLTYWDRDCISEGWVKGESLTADFSTGADLDTNLTLTKGMYILFSYSYRDVDDEYNKLDAPYGLTRPIHYDMVVVTPETKVGTLKGASGYTPSNNWPQTTIIDSTKYDNSCRFALGFEIFEEETDDNHHGMAYNGVPYTWFFDRKGNVIGRIDIGADAPGWYVIDKIWDATAHEDGVYKVKAVLVDLDANLINAEIDSFGLYLGKTDEKGNPIADWFKCYEFEPWAERIHDAYINNGRYYNELYKGTQNKNESYNLVDGITDPTKPVAEFVAHVATGENARVAALENKDGTVYNNGVVDARLSESTRFLVKGVDGTYKAYKGYKALPTLVAYCNDMIDIDGDGFVDVVYLSNAIYGSETILGYVKEGYKTYNWRNGYYLIEVYVNGEKVLLGVNEEVKKYIEDNAPGLFEFRMLGDDEGVSAVMTAEVELAAEFTVDAVSEDGTSAKMTSSAESALKSGTYPLTYENYKFFDANGAATTYKAVKAGQTWNVYIFNGVWYWFLQ